jgi:hypothetical protein
MSVSTRRRFVRQTILAAAGLCASGGPVFARGARKSALLDGSAGRRLASAIKGRVITREASDYESARLIFNRAFDLHPAMIVRCANTSDVARTLEFAQTANLPVAVRGGGHSRAGFSVCDDGVVIDLSPMKRVDVDAPRRLARGEPVRSSATWTRRRCASGWLRLRVVARTWAWSGSRSAGEKAF